MGAFHLELRSISPLTLLLVSLCYSQAAQALRPQTPVSWARGAGSSPVPPSTCGGGGRWAYFDVWGGKVSDLRKGVRP